MSAQLFGLVSALAVLAVLVAGERLVLTQNNSHVRRRLVRPEHHQSWVSRLSSSQFGLTNMLVVVAAVIGLVVDGVVLGILAAFAAGIAITSIRQRSRQRELRMYNRSLVRSLDLMVLSLRSGAGLVSGLREAASAREGAVEFDLREVLRQLDLGMPLVDALQAWPRRCPLRSVRLTVACLTLAHQSGGSGVQSIGVIRTIIRNALAVETSVQTYAAQSRASAMALSLMPLTLAVPMLAFNESARSFMLHEPLGIAVLFCGVALDLVGMWWMSCLIKGAQA